VSTGGSQEIQLKWRFGKVEKKTSAQTSPAPVNTISEETPPQQEKSKQPSEEKQQQEPVQNESRPTVKEETPKQEPTVQNNQPVVEQKVEEKQPPVVEEKRPAVVEPKQEPVVEKKQEPVVEEKQPETPGDYYLIINTFEDRANAEKFYNEVIKQGYKAEMRETKPGVTPHYFYIHLPAYKSKEISVDKVLELQKKLGFKDAWYKKID
jgi:hypothetical protein